MMVVQASFFLQRTSAPPQAMNVSAIASTTSRPYIIRNKYVIVTTFTLPITRKSCPDCNEIKVSCRVIAFVMKDVV